MRVAVVTGAGRGMGAAITRALSADGWAVVAVDVCADNPGLGYSLAEPADLEATAKSCAFPDLVRTVRADVRDQAALDGAVATAVDAFGGLDAAVAAAGVIAGGGPAWETPDDAYAALMDVNAGGVHRLASAAVPALLRRPAPRDGRFVAVASAAAHRGLPRLAAYCASKHACAGYVRGLAADLRGTGITANSVSPGSTETAMLTESARIYDLDGPDDFAHQALLERLLAPEEIAETIRWLCSPSSSGLTGSVLRVDGGLTT
ncbi:mycofactocin-coupled SDR family oxidoreductase [Streptomyces boluensis]|uniref:SDR family mycofactocin-dependent oxidoreductase n=1 Tax=Streptomyces boluensis TaxID=1775135 RepID=A0A964UMN5_9ACTN|nr:mycofactocin-coupled SDR family oxidoreductase [Streptomyces boluensis]NBE51866.1 SDR family mycofactocin-dependent oxidoreductase [Streptomyces boluensis]